MFGAAYKDQTIVAVDKVRYVGDPVAAVAAVDEATAEAALAAIEVDYEALPAVTSIDEALAPGAPLVHESSASGGELMGQLINPQRVCRTNLCYPLATTGRCRRRFNKVRSVLRTPSVPALQHFSWSPATVAHVDGDRSPCGRGLRSRLPYASMCGNSKSSNKVRHRPYLGGVSAENSGKPAASRRACEKS